MTSPERIMTPTSPTVFQVRYVSLDEARIKYRFFVKADAAHAFAERIASTGREVATFVQSSGWQRVDR